MPIDPDELKKREQERLERKKRKQEEKVKKVDERKKTSGEEKESSVVRTSDISNDSSLFEQREEEQPLDLGQRSRMTSEGHRRSVEGQRPVEEPEIDVVGDEPAKKMHPVENKNTSPRPSLFTIDTILEKPFKPERESVISVGAGYESLRSSGTVL